MKSKRVRSGDFALQQIRRLKSKPFYPVTDIDDGKPINHGERELARTLYEYSDSDEHMRRVIDAAVVRSFGESGLDRCPSSSDIWGLCKEINPAPVKAVVINRDCPECEGTGFVLTITVLGISGASRCPRGCGVAGPEHRPPDPKALWSWYRAELSGADDRRAAFSRLRRGTKAPRVTDADIAAMIERQNAKRVQAGE